MRMLRFEDSEIIKRERSNSAKLDFREKSIESRRDSRQKKSIVAVWRYCYYLYVSRFTKISRRASSFAFFASSSRTLDFDLGFL